MRSTCLKKLWFAAELQKTLSSPLTATHHFPERVDKEASGTFSQSSQSLSFPLFNFFCPYIFSFICSGVSPVEAFLIGTLQHAASLSEYLLMSIPNLRQKLHLHNSLKSLKTTTTTKWMIPLSEKEVAAHRLVDKLSVKWLINRVKSSSLRWTFPQPWFLESSWCLRCWRGVPPLHMAEIAHRNR